MIKMVKILNKINNQINNINIFNKLIIYKRVQILKNEISYIPTNMNFAQEYLRIKNYLK